MVMTMRKKKYELIKIEAMPINVYDISVYGDVARVIFVCI